MTESAVQKRASRVTPSRLSRLQRVKEQHVYGYRESFAFQNFQYWILSYIVVESTMVSGGKNNLLCFHWLQEILQSPDNIAGNVFVISLSCCCSGMILNFVKMLAKIHEIKKEIHHLTENSCFKEFIYLFFLIFINLFYFMF